MTYEDQIKARIEEISRDHLVKIPVTVVGAAKLIAEYDGTEKAIELYEGAQEETKENVFRTCAYAATLETILYKTK